MSHFTPLGKGNNVTDRKESWRQTTSAARNGNEISTQTDKTRSNLSTVCLCACECVSFYFWGPQWNLSVEPWCVSDHIIEWISCCWCWRPKSHDFCVTLTFLAVEVNTTAQEGDSNECACFIWFPSFCTAVQMSIRTARPEGFGMFSSPCRCKYGWRWDYLRRQGQGWLCATLTD